MIGVDEGGCSDELEDGECTPWAERIEEDETVWCGDGRIGGICCGIG